MLFAPVTKIFWEKKLLMKSKVPVMNERMVLIVLIVSRVSPPLIAALLVRSEKANTVLLVKQVCASQSMQVLSCLKVERRLPSCGTNKQSFRPQITQASIGTHCYRH